MRVREDAVLVSMCLSGDRQAFGKLVDRYENMVYGFVLNRIGDFDQAEDLAQDVFIEAYTHLTALRRHARFPNWLCGIAKNVCSRWLARRERESEVLDQLASFEEERGRILMFRDTTGPRTPEEEFSSLEMREAIWGAVGELPERSREVVLLFYFNDMSHTEIGKFLGVAPSTVRWHLYNARERLRDRMMPLVEETIRGKRLRGTLAKKVLAALPLISFPKPKPLLPFVRWGLSLKAVLGVVGMFAVVGGLIGWHMFGATRSQSPEVSSPLAVRLATSREIAGLRQQLSKGNDEAAQSLIHQFGGGRITGAVQDVRGRPVPDAHVQIAGVTLPNGLFVYLKDGPEFSVAEDGTYELGELRDGEYMLRFWSDTLKCRGQMEDVSLGREPACMMLGLMGSISGRVTDEKGRSISGAKVSTGIGLYSPSSEGPYSQEYKGITDEEGGYLLNDLPYRFSGIDEVPWQSRTPTQRLWVVASAEGYVTSQKETWLGYGTQEEGVDFELQPGGVSVAGVVRDVSGTPIAGARIDVVGTGARRHAISSDGGRFGIDGLSYGTFRLSVYAEGFSPQEIVGVLEGAEDLEITLSQGGTIMGRVMEGASDAYKDHPLQDVLVQARHQIDRFYASSLTDADGIYRISTLAAGPYRVSVAANRSCSIKGRLVAFEGKNVEVREGEVMAGIDFRLQPGIAISGRLMYRDTGESVGKVRVTLQGSDPMDTVTDKEGQYRFAGVAPGEYWLETGLGGYVEVPYRLKIEIPNNPEAQDIENADLQLVRRAALHIRVMDTDGRPISGAEVRYVTPDQRTDEDGRCQYDGLRPEWPNHLIVDHPEYAFVFVDSLILSPGEHRRITFVLSSGGTLEGMVTNWKGNPVPNARVTVCSPALDPASSWYRRFGRIVHADETGHYRAAHLPRGVLRLRVDHRDPIFAPLEVTVHIGGNGSVTRRDLSALCGGAVVGCVKDANNRPIEGVRVYFAPHRYAWQVLTDQEGRYRAEHVPAGEYEISTDGYYRDERRERNQVVVEDGDVATVNLIVGGG